MRIYLMRHGDAVSKGEDRERPLSAKGRDRTRAAAAAMKALGITFDAILSSPKKRALETAQIVAGELGIPASRIHENDAFKPSGSSAKAVRNIADFADAESVLVTGHLPSIEDICSTLLSGGPGIAVDFPKGGLCLLEVSDPESHKAYLVWVLTPEHLSAIAAASA